MLPYQFFWDFTFLTEKSGHCRILKTQNVWMFWSENVPDPVNPENCAGWPAYEREDLEEAFDGGEVLGVHRLLESARHNAAHLKHRQEIILNPCAGSGSVKYRGPRREPPPRICASQCRAPEQRRRAILNPCAGFWLSGIRRSSACTASSNLRVTMPRTWAKTTNCFKPECRILAR